MISFGKQIFFIISGIVIALLWPQVNEQLKKLYASNVEESASLYDGGRIFSGDELSKYNGQNEPQLYLSLLGNVYDVSSGEKHYGADGSYHYFTGEYFINTMNAM